MEKVVAKVKCLNNAYTSIKEVPKRVVKDYQKQFFFGAMKGFELIDYVDKKYDEIVNDFSELFKRR